MVITALVINLFLALSLFFFQATRKTYPGFGLWTTGVGLLGLGYLALCLRGFVPDFISILLVNALFPLGMVLHLAGMRRFLGLTPMSRLWYALPSCIVAAAAVLYYGYDSEAWRTVSLSIGIAAPHFAMAYRLLGQPMRPRSVFHWVIGSLLMWGGILVLVRAMWSLSEFQFRALMDSPVQAVFFVSVIVLQLGENISFLMLNNERVEAELVQAQTGLKKTVKELERALAEIKTLSGFLPICANCKKIRDDNGYWRAVEQFIEEHSQAQFSHAICPDCLAELYPELAGQILSKHARRK
jgi:hypothetical protein